MTKNATLTRVLIIAYRNMRTLAVFTVLAMAKTSTRLHKMEGLRILDSSTKADFSTRLESWGHAFCLGVMTQTERGRPR